jgi:hypothetical protein
MQTRSIIFIILVICIWSCNIVSAQNTNKEGFYTIVIHGGAGNMDKKDISDSLQKSIYRQND